MLVAAAAMMTLGCSSGSSAGGSSEDGGAPSRGDSGAVSAPDGGTVDDASGGGPGAFVGTWMRAGTETVTCPSGTTTTNLTGDLMIQLAAASDTIAGLQPDGCLTIYTVAGDIATAESGQSCYPTTEAGVEMISVISHTLTLSADGETLMSMGSENIDKTATMTECTSRSSGTYTKVTPM